MSSATAGLVLFLSLLQELNAQNNSTEQLWTVRNDGTRQLHSFTGHNTSIVQFPETTSFRIVHSDIQAIEENDLRPGPNIVNASLEVVNTTIHDWHPNDMTAFASISFIASTIKQLHTHGINVTRRNADNCSLRNKTTTTIRFINSTIEELHDSGIVIEAAHGSLHLDGSTISTLHQRGIRLAFRVELTVTGSVIGNLPLGAFCGVCSDIIHFDGNNIRNVSAPSAQSLTFGSPACLAQCPQQRLHVHKIANNTLPYSTLPELRKALHRCRLHQPPPAAACCDGDAKSATNATCADLSRFAKTSLSAVRTDRLLRYLEPEPDAGWCATPAVAVGTAVALAAGFLAVGVLAGCCCCPQQRRGGGEPPAERENTLKVSSPLNTSFYRRQRTQNVVDQLRRLGLPKDSTADAERSDDQPHAVGAQTERTRQNEYEMTPQEEPPVGAPESPLPAPPPSWPKTSSPATWRSPTGGPRSPQPIYENLHGRKGRKKR